MKHCYEVKVEVDDDGMVSSVLVDGKPAQAEYEGNGETLWPVWRSADEESVIGVVEVLP